MEYHIESHQAGHIIARDTMTYNIIAYLTAQHNTL